MLGPIFATLFLFYVGTAVSGQKCLCNYISHPQSRFCEASFAFRGEILNAESAPLPGEVDLGNLYNGNLRYNVTVTKIFKGGSQHITKDVVSLFTPTGGLCGKSGLLHAQFVEKTKNDYLFTGDIALTTNGRTYLVITNCNWVERWVDVGKEQEAGLKGLYSDCECVIYRRSQALERGNSDADNFQVEDCVFNPVSASILSVTDCETEFGYCIEGEDDACRWASSPNFDTCFASRDRRLNIGAAAVTNRKDCNIYKGRMKKKCIKTLQKSKIQVYS